MRSHERPASRRRSGVSCVAERAAAPCSRTRSCATDGDTAPTPAVATIAARRCTSPVASSSPTSRRASSRLLDQQAVPAELEALHEAATEARAALIAYRDDPAIQTALGAEHFAAGLATRVQQERRALGVDRGGARPPAGPRTRWTRALGGPLGPTHGRRASPQHRTAHRRHRRRARRRCRRGAGVGRATRR